MIIELHFSLLPNPTEHTCTYWCSTTCSPFMKWVAVNYICNLFSVSVATRRRTQSRCCIWSWSPSSYSTCITRSSLTRPSSPSAMSWVHCWEAVLAWRTYAGEGRGPTSKPNLMPQSLYPCSLNPFKPHPNPFDPASLNPFNPPQIDIMYMTTLPLPIRNSHFFFENVCLHHVIEQEEEEEEEEKEELAMSHHKGCRPLLAYETVM